MGEPLQEEKGTSCFLNIYDVLFRELLQDLAFMQSTDFIPISEVLEKSQQKKGGWLSALRLHESVQQLCTHPYFFFLESIPSPREHALWRCLA